MSCRAEVVLVRPQSGNSRLFLVYPYQQEESTLVSDYRSLILELAGEGLLYYFSRARLRHAPTIRKQVAYFSIVLVDA